MPQDLVIAGARIVDGDEIVENGWVRFDGDRVDARGRGSAPGPVDVDAGGALLVPGFVDLHVHGGGGTDFGAGATALPDVLGVHRAHGTTRTALSLVSAPLEVLLGQIASLAPAVRADPLLLGIHLEGPFLSPHNRGAHDPAALTVPTAAEVDALLAAADGTLLQVTIAPELPGGDKKKIS